MPDSRRVRPGSLMALLGVLLATSLLPGCAALRELAAVRQLDFSFQDITDVRVAEVELRRVQHFEELGITDVTRLTRAYSDGRLPLSATVRVQARNPEENPRARIVGLNWDLRLRGRDTVSGGMDQEVVVEPGAVEEVDVAAELDLLEFFDGGVRDVADVALALVRDELSGDDVQLRVRPDVSTRLGSIGYESPLLLSPGEASRGGR